MVNSTFQKLKDANKNIREKLNLKGCLFQKTNLENSVFAMCDLSGVDFSGANLQGVVFEKCDLTGTDFSDCNLNGTGFGSSKIDKTILDVEGFISFGNSKGFVLRQ